MGRGISNKKIPTGPGSSTGDTISAGKKVEDRGNLMPETESKKEKKYDV